MAATERAPDAARGAPGRIRRSRPEDRWSGMRSVPHTGPVHAGLRVVALVVALLAPPAGGRAQAAPELGPGTRLRATVGGPAPRVEVGRFARLTDTTLVLARGGRSRPIPLSDIARLEWSAGRRPGILGGVVGLVVGAAVGGAVGCAVNRDSYGVYCGGQDDTKVAVGAVIGGLAGGAAGALLTRRERWRPVELDRLRPGGA